MHTVEALPFISGDGNVICSKGRDEGKGVRSLPLIWVHEFHIKYLYKLFGVAYLKE